MKVTINDPSTIMAVNGRVTSNDLRIGTAIAIAMPTNAVDWRKRYAIIGRPRLPFRVLCQGRSPNGRFLRHRFSPKPINVATAISLPKEHALPKRRCPRRGKPKRDNGAKERGKPIDAPRTKPWPCVKTMLYDRQSSPS